VTEISMEQKKRLAAPCGLDCFHCELYEANAPDSLIEHIAEKTGIPREEIPCKGCRETAGKHYHIPAGGCATLNCVTKRGVSLCSECGDFPCALLAPLAEGASFYPHNMKVYNLCRIKAVGLENWIRESGEIRRKYYTSPFVVGKGQEE